MNAKQCLERLRSCPITWHETGQQYCPLLRMVYRIGEHPLVIGGRPIEELLERGR